MLCVLSWLIKRIWMNEWVHNTTKNSSVNSREPEWTSAVQLTATSLWNWFWCWRKTSTASSYVNLRRDNKQIQHQQMIWWVYSLKVATIISSRAVILQHENRRLAQWRHSAVKEPGHFEVRKSSSQVTRMHFFPQKSLRPFQLSPSKHRPPTPFYHQNKTNKAVRYGNIFIFCSHCYRSKAIGRARQGGARTVDLPARYWLGTPWCSAATGLACRNLTHMGQLINVCNASLFWSCNTGYLEFFKSVQVDLQQSKITLSAYKSY